MARVLITGCSTGIGRATAVELTKRGHEVVATARRPETLADLDVADRLALDVDDDGSVAAALDGGGRVDVLVNNAGFEVSGPIEKIPLDEVRRMFETNVFGALRMIQAFLPQMRERGSGTIVNVSSVAGRAGAPLGGLYSASKWALEAISESLHLEAGHFGVRVVLIEPGAIETSFQDNIRRFGVDDPPYDELARRWERSMDLLRGGDPPGPEIVAAAIAEALESDGPAVRIPVGADAEMVITTRDSMDDTAFEAAMREVLQFDW
jgi:NAD(P)-dependent dehydrogenase (short-subunit alcohol dehydrogenase family)